MLSKYCKQIADKYEIKVGDVQKLIPNLGSKTNYVVHYRNLHQYLSLPMKLTKLHRELKFKQSDWIKNMLILTLKKKLMLLMILKKIFFKLIINFVYGKTIENLRKRINVKLVNNEEEIF